MSAREAPSRGGMSLREKSVFDQLLTRLAAEHHALQRRYDELAAQSTPLNGGHSEPQQLSHEHQRDVFGASSASGSFGGSFVSKDSVQSPHWRAPPAPPPPVPNGTSLPSSPVFRAPPPLLSPPRVAATASAAVRDVDLAVGGEAMKRSLDMSWQAFKLEAPHEEERTCLPNDIDEDDEDEAADEETGKQGVTERTALKLAPGAPALRGDEESEPRASELWSDAEAMAESMTLSMTVWPEWVDLVNKDGAAMVPRLSTETKFCAVNRRNSRSRSKESSSFSSLAPGLERLIMQPNCTRKLLWDLIGLMCLCWDFISIPLVVFNIEDDPVIVSSSIVISTFWTIDIVLTFFTGFYDKGQMELEAMAVWKKYARTWLVPDLALVTIDWTVIYFQQEPGGWSDYSQIGRMWRTMRFLRMFRLLRIIKASRMFEELTDLVHSEALQTTLVIAKLVWGVAMINHIIACAWYALGSMESVQEASWVSSLSAGAAIKEEHDDYYTYFSALHWSLTQFTPASMEVVPRNKYERIFAISTILLALVVFSSFVSSITTAMTHLRSIKLKQTRTQANIRKYITHNKLSSELSLQVHRFARVHHKKSMRVLMSDLHFVRYLPELLRIQLHLEVYLPRLKRHPLFLHWSRLDEAGITKVCYTAMSERALLAGEELFTYGDQCSRMYFALEGNMQYYHHTTDADQITDITGSERDPKRISEIVLWMPWEHRGRVVANTSAFLLTLDSAKFRGVAKGRAVIVGPACLYAASYISELLKACDGQKDLLLDVWDERHILNQVATSAFDQSGVAMSARYSYHSQSNSSLFDGVASLFGRKRSK